MPASLASGSLPIGMSFSGHPDKENITQSWGQMAESSQQELTVRR